MLKRTTTRAQPAQVQQRTEFRVPQLLVGDAIRDDSVTSGVKYRLAALQRLVRDEEVPAAHGTHVTYASARSVYHGQEEGGDGRIRILTAGW